MKRWRYVTRAAQGYERDVVWWTDGGRVIHLSHTCPTFARASARHIAAARSGDMERANLVHYYSYVDNTYRDLYPPIERDLCCDCGWLSNEIVKKLQS